MRKLVVFIILAVLTFTFTASARALSIEGDVCTIEAEAVLVRGKTYVPIIDVCRAYGIGIEWDGIAKRIVLTRNGDSAVMLLGSNKIYYDDKVKRLTGDVKLYKSKIIVPLTFAKKTIKSVFKVAKTK